MTPGATRREVESARAELRALGAAYGEVLDALVAAGFDAYPTTTGGNCAALEIQLPNDHLILITDQNGPLPWNGDHDGWAVSRCDAEGRIGADFTHDDDAIITAPDGAPSALLAILSEVAAWTPA